MQMKPMVLLRFCLVLAALAAMGGCGRKEAPAPAAEGKPSTRTAGKLQVFVTIAPQAYAAREIAGDHATVSILVEPGSNPHVYEPTPRQMANLGQADLYFLAGVPFEDVLKERIEAANPKMRLIDTGRGIKLRATLADEADEDQPTGKASGMDPHTWLNPLNMKVMASNMADALIEADANHAADYRRNLSALSVVLDQLDADIRDICKDLKKREFMVYHPAFGYFADAYGLKQIPIEIEGKEPTAQTLAAAIERAKKDQIKVIFVQPQFSRKSAQAVAEEIGGRVVVADNLAEDYVGNMRNMARAFVEAMR